MAINPVVLVSRDRRWRIESAGDRYQVYRDRVWLAEAYSVPELAQFLADNGVGLADLIED